MSLRVSINASKGRLPLSRKEIRAVLSYLFRYYRLNGEKEIHLTVCSNDCIKKINRKYLNKDRPTDVIVFDLSDTQDRLWGEMLISLDMVRANCKEFHTTRKEELALYLIHAFLHLMGYSDKGAQRAIMKKKEEKLLAIVKKKKII